MWQFAILSQCCSPSIQICPFHPLSSHQLTPFFSLTPHVSCFLPPFQSFSPSIFTGALWMFLLSLPFMIFFMQDISLNNFKSQSLAFAISAPILPLCASFSCFSVIFYFLSFFVSLARRLCVYMLSRDWKEAPEQKCGCMWTRMRERESVPASLTLPLCQCLPLGCQWQSEFICCAVTGLMIDVAPANSKPIRRLM